MCGKSNKFRRLPHTRATHHPWKRCDHLNTAHITLNPFVQLMGFDGGVYAGISDDADAKFLVKAKFLLEMQIETACKDRY